MNNNSIYFVLLIVLLSFLGSSCKTEESKSNLDKYHSDDSTFTGNRLLKISLDHTFFIKNKFGYGKLIYDVNHDSLMPNDIVKRYIFIAVSGNAKALDYKSIVKTADDAVLDSTSFDKIEFEFKVKFSEIGKQELKIAVKEYTTLKTKDALQDLVDVIESDTIHKIPVLVKDSI